MLSNFNSNLSNECTVPAGQRTMQNNPVRNNTARCASFFYYFTRFTRVWGLLAIAVLCGVGIDFAFHRQKTGYYLIGASAFALFLETTWIVTLFLKLCVRNESRFVRCWTFVSSIEGWKKTLVYLPMGIVPLMLPHKLWLVDVAAFFMITLSIFHFVLSYKTTTKKKKPRERLLHGDVDSFESKRGFLSNDPCRKWNGRQDILSIRLRKTSSSKFEEVTEVLDDAMPEPIPGSSHSLSDSLAEQDTILEI